VGNHSIVHAKNAKKTPATLTLDPWL